MSNRLAMPALDKVEKKFSVRVETLARLEKRASKAGIHSRVRPWRDTSLLFFENRVEPNQSH